MDQLFALIGGPKQLPLYAYLLPIPLLLWAFAAEVQSAVSSSAPDASVGPDRATIAAGPPGWDRALLRCPGGTC